MRKKQLILKTEVDGDLVKARIPRGTERFEKCYLTESESPNQQPHYNAVLILGRDYEIRGDMFVSRKISIIGENFILVEIEQASGKLCKTCRRESNNKSFCSHCGTFLF